MIKREFAELVSKQDYTTLNTLSRRNFNASKLDTRILNEDTPQDNKRFSKFNGKLPIRLSSNTYKACYYDPHPILISEISIGMMLYGCSEGSLIF